MGTQANVAVLPQDTATLRIEQLTLPDPGPTQVVVKQFASGVCHSQLHQMHRPRTAPVVLGHESTGVILKAGADVTHVEEGDTVLVTWVPRDVLQARNLPARARLEVSDGEAVSENVFTILVPKNEKTESLLIFGTPQGQDKRAAASGEIGRLQLR